MDPDECYRLWWRAVLAEDREAANEAYFNLRMWLERGGFEPSWSTLARKQFFTYSPRTGRLE